jgi:small subunit ribosomal protein S2
VAVSMKTLLEAGVHFGHKKQRWNPKMKPYIFAERNGIHILDLQQTIVALEKACEAVKETASKGGIILFVGTKRQAQETIEAEAKRCGMPYVNVRWLGGTLTNFSTIKKRIEYLEMMERQKEMGEFDRLPKKEALQKERELERLRRKIGGLRGLNRLPDMLYVVDVVKEELAVKEANRLGIPVVGVVDTNADPELVTYCIPANDDAIRAIKVITSEIASAVLEGRQLYETIKAEAGEEEEIALSVEEELPIEHYLGPSVLEKLKVMDKEALDLLEEEKEEWEKPEEEETEEE